MHSKAASAELGMPTELCVLDSVTGCVCHRILWRADGCAKFGKYASKKSVEYQKYLRIVIPA